MAEALVIDASAVVDLLLPSERAPLIRVRLRGAGWHVPGHCEAEVLCALGGLARGGHLTGSQVGERLALLASMPLVRHEVSGLLIGAWARRDDLSLLDALYVELARRIGTVVVTTDLRLARATPLAEAVTN